MKRGLTVLLISTTFILLCFLAVVCFTLPSFYSLFNLTSESKNNIGGTIGGLTTPVIGIISSILLYLALSKQTESYNDQRIKNESDIIFLLINQLDNEIANFYLKVQERNNVNPEESKDIKVVGLEGFNDFCFNCHFRYDFSDRKTDASDTFKARYEAGYIILLISSFNLIQQRVEISSAPFDMRNLFVEKLNFYYRGKLRILLNNLVAAFEKFPHQKDEYTSQIEDFVKEQESKQGKSFKQEFFN